MRVGIKPIGGSAVKSRKMARKITSKYHVLQKQKQAALSIPDKEEREAKLSKVDDELSSMGGIQRYQEASVISTQHFKTSKWVLQTLRRIGKLPSACKLTTLEVGAINDQLSLSPLLRVRAIDINAQLPCIEECNFFDVPPAFSYDVVVCSMVINCVFHPFKRGEMLLRLLSQLKEDGVLFLILPTRCLQATQLRSANDFLALLLSLGFVLAEDPHTTPHLTFYVLSPNPAWRTVISELLPQGSNHSTSSSSRTIDWKDVVREYFVQHTIPSIFSNSASASVSAPASSLSRFFDSRSLDEVLETIDFSILLSTQDFAPPGWSIPSGSSCGSGTEDKADRNQKKKKKEGSSVKQHRLDQKPNKKSNESSK